MARVGLLVGTGFDAAPLPVDRVAVDTPWGDVEVGVARDGPNEFFVVPRHGARTRPAHVVDHRANLDALARCRVDRVLAAHSVGALHTRHPPGSFVVPDDYFDLRARESFHDDAAIHVDVSTAYCPECRDALIAAAGAADGGVYACTPGPRLETRAEVRMLRAMGGDVVGMTGAPEASLARERALCYASLCVVTNLAAGVAGARASADDIRARARDLAPRTWGALLVAARTVGAPKACACREALATARL